MGGGYLFGGPNYEDNRILGSILGVPLFWESTEFWMIVMAAYG